MTPRTFFTLLIKILGIYLVLGSISVVPEFASTIFMFADTSGNNDTGIIVLTLFMLVLTLGLFFIILKYCLYKTDWIIDKLSLDKHFTEEKIEINIHRSTFLGIAIIVIGGLMFVDGLPSFCKSVFDYFSQKHAFGRFGENPMAGWLFFYFIKTSIGYLLMTNHRPLVNLIERQRKQNDSKN